MQLSVIAISLSSFFFVICCLIPESPRYHAYCEMKHTFEYDKAVKSHNLWSAEDLQRKSIVDLFDELKKLNLLSLIGLILVEQFIGGVSILFYMKHFAQLTGELGNLSQKWKRLEWFIHLWTLSFLRQLRIKMTSFLSLRFRKLLLTFLSFFQGGLFSPELMATTVGLTLIFSIPLSKMIGFTRISSTKRQIIVSTVAILLEMILLAGFCILEGSMGHKLEIIGLNHVPLVVFITVTFFYVVGISRNSLLIMQQILSSYSLQLHLRTLSVAVTWFFIFAITKILPQLLYLVGVGYIFGYLAVFTLISLIFLCKIMPSSLNLEIVKATPSVMEASLVVSSASSETPSFNLPSTCSSYNEVHQVENV